MNIKWISESEALPRVAQPVFFMAPKQADNHWTISVACILIRYEEVHPHPVKPGSRWPIEFWWGRPRGSDLVSLVTGNGWWAAMDDIPLPPGAEHRTERGYHFIAQPEDVFVGQGK